MVRNEPLLKFINMYRSVKCDHFIEIMSTTGKVKSYMDDHFLYIVFIHLCNATTIGHFEINLIVPNGLELKLTMLGK